MTGTEIRLALPTDKIVARKHAGIGWLTLNRPERRNAISLEMSEAIAAAAADFADDADVRVVVIHGAGGAFSAGADIGEFEKLRSDAESAARYRKRTVVAENILSTLQKPVIAMIRGYCMGGGVILALVADIRIASSDSRFGIPAAKLGNAYPRENLRRLVHLVGPAKAKEILFTGRQFSAAEAHAMGLINSVTEPEAIESTVVSLAEEIAANAPLSLRALKESVNSLTGDSTADDTVLEALSRACADSEDYKEARRAFMEKRRPVFHGR